MADLLGPPGDGKPLQDRLIRVDDGLAVGEALADLMARPPRNTETLQGMGDPAGRVERNYVDVPAFPDGEPSRVVDVRDLGPGPRRQGR